MRFAASCRVLSLALLVIVACWAGPAGAQSAELEEALQEFVREIGTFIDAVRFDQNDIEFFVASWPEIDSIFEDEDTGDGSMDDVLAGLGDLMDLIQEASSHAEYRAWAAANGVDGDEWMRKAMRIMLLSQQYGMLMQSEAIDIDAQIAQIEAQRDAYGDEAADASIEAVQPTDSENSLLEDYWPQLVTAMETGSGGGDGFGDDEWGDDEWADDDWGVEGEDDDAVDIGMELPEGALPFDPDGTSYSEFFYGSSYLRKGRAPATVKLILASSDRHCYLEDEGIMAMDDGDTTIYTVYCLTHAGEVEEGDDVVVLTVMAAPVDLVGDVFGRPKRGWTAISVDRWVE